MEQPVSVFSGDISEEERFFSRKAAGWGQLVWKRFLRHRFGLIGLITLAVLIVLALLAPVVAPYPQTAMDFENSLAPPGAAHWLGTDNLGRDWFSRALYGGRVSLLVGFSTTFLALMVGVPIGCIAGYFGGWFDTVITHLIQFFYSIPQLFLILAINALLTPSAWNVIWVLAMFRWMSIARQVRAQFLKMHDMEHVQAAVSEGLGTFTIIRRHILPFALTPVIVSATMGVASAILTESALSYLGLGVQEPQASWGNMLKAAQSHIFSAPWLAIVPGILITLVSLACNFAGDAFRDAIDPRATRQ